MRKVRCSVLRRVGCLHRHLLFPFLCAGELERRPQRLRRVWAQRCLRRIEIVVLIVDGCWSRKVQRFWCGCSCHLWNPLFVSAVPFGLAGCRRNVLCLVHSLLCTWDVSQGQREDRMMSSRVVGARVGQKSYNASPSRKKHD